MGELFTADEVRDALVFAIEAAGGQAAYALRVGVSRAHVCRVLSGQKRPNGAILRDLGFRDAELFEPISPRPKEGE